MSVLPVSVTKDEYLWGYIWESPELGSIRGDGCKSGWAEEIQMGPAQRFVDT